MRNVRTVVGFLAAAMVALAAPQARSQSLDVFAGLNGLTAHQAVQNIPRLGGGLFPSAGADLFLGPVGLGAEATFRAGQNSSGLRPSYYDVNLLFDPIHIGREFIPVFMVGLGAQSIKDYQGLARCGGLGGCADYSSTHFTGHVGVGLKAYLTEHIFLRPEAHFYFIRHNGQLDATNSQRFGLSLGYSFGG